MNSSVNISDYKGDFGGRQMRTRIKKTRPQIEMMTRKQRRMMEFQKLHLGKSMILMMSMTTMMRTKRTQSPIMSQRMMLEIISHNIETRGQSMKNQNQRLNQCQSPSHNQGKISPQNILSRSLNLSQMIIRATNLEKIEFDLNKMS